MMRKMRMAFGTHAVHRQVAAIEDQITDFNISRIHNAHRVGAGTGMKHRARRRSWPGNDDVLSWQTTEVMYWQALHIVTCDKLQTVTGLQGLYQCVIIDWIGADYSCCSRNSHPRPEDDYRLPHIAPGRSHDANPTSWQVSVQAGVPGH